MKRSYSLSFWLFLVIGTVVAILGIRCFWFVPQHEEALLKNALGVEALDFAKMKQVAKVFQVQPPTITQREIERAKLGKALFFDKDLSRNGKIACSSCHQPDKSFTDGLSRAEGLSPRPRNTPTLINSASSFWFYWDGRTDSLASQSLNPIEDEGEHGFTRAEVARLITKKYRAQYESLFGKIPKSLSGQLPIKAKASKPTVEVSDKVIRFAMASTTNPKLIKEIGDYATEISAKQIKQYRQRLITTHKDESEEAEKNYQRLNPQTKNELNHLFANVGLSLEAYEKSITALNSPFDVFIKRWVNSHENHPKKYFSKEFGFNQFLGFQLFLGKGSCQLCHTGPYFKDNQFHNIGLPQTENFVDLGRSHGILKVKKDPFNCKGSYFKDSERTKSESCQDLDFLDSETPEAIGAFKTPTLRNVAQTGPYMRDGRFNSIRQVLDHYNRMDTFSGVGFREETLKPLGLSELELSALEAFLISLSSPIQELPY